MRRGLLELGADTNRVVVAGNLKYDLDDPPDSPLSKWLAEELSRNHRQPVLVAGSVAANEEIHVLQAFPRSSANFLSSRAISARAAQTGTFRDERQGLWRNRAGICCADPKSHSMAQGARRCPGLAVYCCSIAVGELASVYRLGRRGFCRRPLIPGGGHNILEPAAFSKVPVYGPFMENFREMARIS